jgi:CBS domain-containing protein
MTTVKKVMHQGAEVEAPDCTVADLSRKMRELDIGCLLIGENDRLVGVVTDRDIVVKCIANGREPSQTAARDIMSNKPHWCFDDADVKDVAKMMRERGVRRLPVINHDKRLVGVVTVGDLTAASSKVAGEALHGLSAARA